jgi:lipid-binding SYLF domain-containing protein
MISKRSFSVLAVSALTLGAVPAWADDYQDATKVFKKADVSGKLFKTAYGYALFPTIGKGGAVVAGAFGRGRVYQKGKYIGDASMTQVSVGLQLGGVGYSQIIFFENEAALKEFTKGEFEFGAEASAVAITVAANAKAGTAGAAAGAQAAPDKAKNVGLYNNGMATFTVVKGGAMYEVALAGQKFNYTPKAAAKAK